MITTCWNCQGVGNNLAVRHLKDILGQYNPQVIFLSETKQRRAYMEKLCEDTGFHDMCTVEPQGLSGGLALLWKEEVEISVISTSTNWIDTHVTWQNHRFYLTGIYGEPIANAREEVWESLVRLGEDREDPWFLFGDFNELLSNEEKRGGRIRPECSFYAFRNVLTKCGLQELPYEGNSFSWFGSRGGELVHCKLDRVLVNSLWMNKFPSAYSEYLPRIGSDHSPLNTYFQFGLRRKRGFFRYDSRWKDKEDLQALLADAWLSTSQVDDSDFIDRLRRCRGAMSHWKRSFQSNSRHTIDALKRQVDLATSQDTIDWVQFKALKCSLMEAYLMEEKFWKDRSRETWLREGDRNTKFFHASVKQKRAQHRVSQLIDMNTGIFYHSDSDMRKLAKHFFINLFTSELVASSEVRHSAMFQGVTRKVTAEHNAHLIAPALDTEIKRAVYDMAAEKCPGPDGLTGAFYQHHWSLVGPKVCDMVRSFLQTGELDSRLNETNICLIPKTRKPTKLTEFRPISLCNFSYKIIAKVLSTRLKKILPDIISETQAAFVSGRLISDNILLAHEIIHSLKVLPHLSSSCVAVKTDMMKAFDRVEWQFLEDSMRVLGFHEKWINWIMVCVSTVSFGVLLNGQVGERFQPSRGIRQGDPLSPFLFILCTEILIMRLHRSDTDQQLQGIQITPNAPSVSHLFFADDSLFFSSIHDSQLLYLKAILEDYREASGQRVNFDKSSIIYGKTISDQEKMRVKSETGIHKEGGSGIYLGLPEAFVGSKTETLRFLEEKLKSRINSWKTKFLSQGGKETLLKSVAFALPTYAMSCFLLPKTMIQRLNQEFSKFWWKNQQTHTGIHWLSWERLVKPKKDGGMGFRDLEGSNIALLGKQYWRLATQPTSILARVLAARYHPNSSITLATLGTRPSFGWRSILASQSLMRTGIKFEIGNDQRFDMWTEPWLLDHQPRPPQARFGINHLQWSIGDFKEDNSDQWNLDRLYQVFDADEVTRILQIKPGGPGSTQGFSWIHSDSGSYSVKSGYRLWQLQQNQAVNPVPEHKVDYSEIFTKVWSLSTSPKLKNFIWKCLHVALPVGEMLIRKRIAQCASCVMCDNDEESLYHLLFTCACARALWSLSPFVAVLADDSCSIQGKIHACMLLNEGQHEEDRDLWIWIIWRLWKLRNAKFFQNHQPDIVTAFNMARADLSEWRAQQTLTVPVPLPQVEDRVLMWLPPPENVLKCNIDATWQDNHDRCGVAWILRDHTGRLKFWGAKTYPKLLSPLDAEATALVWATMCIGNMGYGQVVFESDSSTLIEAVNNQIIRPKLQSYITEIHNRMHQEHRHFSFCKVNRQGNQAADRLAKYAKDLSMYSGTIDISVPLWLSPFLDQTL